MKENFDKELVALRDFYLSGKDSLEKGIRHAECHLVEVIRNFCKYDDEYEEVGKKLSSLNCDMGMHEDCDGDCCEK